jgi:hypothetical protein
VPSGVGPRALIVSPSGSAALVTLPAEPAAMAAAIHEAVGGYFGAPVAGDDWVAYAAEDPDPGEPANVLADIIAGQLRGRSGVGPLLIGVVVFLGRDGSQEVDVPMRMLGLADPGARPEPTGPRLRMRVYVDGEVAREDWIGAGSTIDGAQLAAEHADITEAAAARGSVWQVEIYDPTAPDGEQYHRYGTDQAGMVLPMAIIPGPPGYPPQSAN